MRGPYLSSASTADLPGPDGIPSNKHVLSPSDDNGPLALAMPVANTAPNIRDLVFRPVLRRSVESKPLGDEPQLNARRLGSLDAGAVILKLSRFLIRRTPLRPEPLSLTATTILSFPELRRDL